MHERPLFSLSVFEYLMSRSAHKLTKKSPALNCIQLARVCQLRRRNQAKREVDGQISRIVDYLSSLFPSLTQWQETKKATAHIINCYLSH
jgi:hypothetical protein